MQSRGHAHVYQRLELVLKNLMCLCLKRTMPCLFCGGRCGTGPGNNEFAPVVYIYHDGLVERVINGMRWCWEVSSWQGFAMLWQLFGNERAAGFLGLIPTVEAQCGMYAGRSLAHCFGMVPVRP
jgi:hypothetical protein